MQLSIPDTIVTKETPMFAEFTLEGVEKLKVAVLVDVDGTIAGFYENGVREYDPPPYQLLKSNQITLLCFCGKW